MAQALAVGTVLSATDSVTCLTLIDQEHQPVIMRRALIFAVPPLKMFLKTRNLCQVFQALHAILFGESVVNDATALALFHAARKYAGRGLLSSATMVALTAG